MFKYLIAFCFLSTLISHSSAADSILKEYRIPASALSAFSSAGVTARLCNQCDFIRIESTHETALFERSSEIGLKKATELYVSPKHPYVSLYVYENQGKHKLFALRFGSFIENQNNEKISNIKGIIE